MFNLLNDSIAKSNIEVDNPGLGSGIGWIISTAVNVVTIIAFGVSLAMLAYAFVQFIISSGDPKRLVAPKNAVMWSIMGLVLATLLQGIKIIILKTLGYDEGKFF